MAYSYEVVRPFVDAEDNKPYVVGDIYPTDITDERITQLHADNKFNKQYIKLVVDDKNTKAELIEIAQNMVLKYLKRYESRHLRHIGGIIWRH